MQHTSLFIRRRFAQTLRALWSLRGSIIFNRDNMNKLPRLLQVRQCHDYLFAAFLYDVVCIEPLITAGYGLLVTSSMHFRTASTAASPTGSAVSQSSNPANNASSKSLVYNAKKKSSSSLSSASTASLATTTASSPSGLVAGAAATNWSRDVFYSCLELVKEELAQSKANIAQFVSKIQNTADDKKATSKLETVDSEELGDESAVTNTAVRSNRHDSDSEDDDGKPAMESSNCGLQRPPVAVSRQGEHNPLEDHSNVLPQVHGDLLQALAILLAVDRVSAARIPAATGVFAKLISADPELRALLTAWTAECTSICLSVLEVSTLTATNSAQGGKQHATIDKSWQDLRKMLKILKATCDNSSSNKVE
jgi:hypothetical protein